jgi:elongator complex protein 5
MPLLLPSIVTNPQRTQQPFLLLQSSTAQTCLPVLRKIINREPLKTASKQTHSLLICFLHLPSSLTNEKNLQTRNDKIQILDYTDRVPGYNDPWIDPREDIINTVKAGKYLSIFSMSMVSKVQQFPLDH